MTQRLRVPHWATGAALAAALLVTVPASAAPGAAAPTVTGRTTDAPGGPWEELAGSAAGEGRERPGRPAAEPASVDVAPVSRPLRPARPLRPGHPVRPAQPPGEPVVPPEVAPEPRPHAVPSPPSSVTAIGTGPNERAADLAAHMLPLGTGLALMGLGLGFMGMRLRRGR
ncbi:hypothetical protein [Streptomyces sp. NPDC001568]|uniref:hypothetical protein n=1 Tax=Streptomyces sp. NPDC001568 TaxID=3364588 RepID=UPI003680837A